MKNRFVAVSIVLAIGVAGLLYWRLGKTGDGAGDSADAGVARAAVADIERPPAPARDQGNAPAAPPSEIVLDDDPAGTLRLEGQVIDLDELPVAGATVMLSANPPRVTRAEADGSFAFDRLVPRTYSVTARRGDLVGGPVVHDLTGASEPVVIRVVAGATLDVEVVDESGAPIAGATVELRETEPRSLATDQGGKAQFRGVASGFVTVVASAPGRGAVHHPVQVPEGPGVAVSARVILRPGAGVAGKVVTGDGRPVAGARVVARDASALWSLENLRRDGVLTGEDGRFELSPRSAGTYRFTAVHADYAPASTEPITVDGVTPVRDIDIVVEPGGIIAGEVVDGTGQPVPHASVRLMARRAGGMMARRGRAVRRVIAGERGEFRVTGLARAELLVMAESDRASSAAVTVDLRQVSERTDVVLSLTIAGTIAGRVVDSAGEPVAEAQVTAFPDFWDGAPTDDFALRGTAAEITGGGGDFVFRGLPEGTYRLRASRSSMRSRRLMQPGVQAATGDREVTLVLDPPGGITGTVQFEGGGAPEAFTVTVGLPPGVPVASGTGEFTVSDVPPGTYDVSFRGPSFAKRTVRDVEVAAGQDTDMGTVTVKRGRSASGVVVDASGAPVAGASVVAARQLIGDGKSVSAGVGAGGEEFLNVRRTVSGDDGHFHLSGIGTGELKLVAEHDERGRSLPVTIPAGTSSVAYDLTLQPFGAVFGTITAGGEPASKVMVSATPKGSDQMLIVHTGQDGSYAFERLPAGPHRITATMRGRSIVSTSAAGKDIEVVAGEKVRADIDVPLGDITVAVTVEGEGGAAIDAAQIFLLPGEVSPATAKELTEVYLQSTGGAKQSLAMGTMTVELQEVAPGQYSVCVIPINGDMSDLNFRMRLQEHASELRVYCAAKAVDASPDRQTHTAVVPPMEPLPAGEPGDGEP